MLDLRRILLTLMILRSFHWLTMKSLKGIYFVAQISIICVLHSGGVDLVFNGRDLNVVATQMMIVIFDNDTSYVELNSTVVSLCISFYCN